MFLTRLEHPTRTQEHGQERFLRGVGGFINRASTQYSSVVPDFSRNV